MVRRRSPKEPDMAKKSPQKTKKQTCIDMLKRPKGASLAELQKATGWQSHSVRGFLSGTVKKMPGIALVAEVTDDSGRRYRVETEKAS